MNESVFLVERSRDVGATCMLCGLKEAILVYKLLPSNSKSDILSDTIEEFE